MGDLLQKRSKNVDFPNLSQSKEKDPVLAPNVLDTGDVIEDFEVRVNVIGTITKMAFLSFMASYVTFSGTRSLRLLLACIFAHKHRIQTNNSTKAFSAAQGSSSHRQNHKV